MRSILHHNVPRFITHIKERGGVSDEEWRWLKCEENSPQYPEAIINRADEYLLFPKSEEDFNQGLFILIKALAIMSFIPDGVRFLGLRFCSQIDNFVEEEP